MIVLTRRKPEINSRVKTPGAYSTTTLLPLFKKQLKWDEADTSEDDLMVLYLVSTIKQAEAYTRRAIDRATWETYLDSFYDFTFDVSPVDLASGFSVKYYNSLDVLTTLATTEYTLINNGADSYAAIEFESGLPELYDRHEPVVIEFLAGYTTYPSDLQAIILQQAADYFEHRTNDIVASIDQVSFGFHQRLFPFKML